MEREADYIDFPKLCRPQKSNQRCIQFNVDLIPDFDWGTHIYELTKKWVKEKKFKKQGTIWSICLPSVDFGELIHAEFILPCGLPGFKDFLYKELMVISHDSVKWSSTVFLREDPWITVCHVQEGKVWQQLDSTLWSSD